MEYRNVLQYAPTLKSSHLFNYLNHENKLRAEYHNSGIKSQNTKHLPYAL